MNPYNWRQDYGNSNWDIRHRFVTHYLYELPFFRGSKGILHTALGDWQLSGIITLQSGLPFNVTISTDTANTSARGMYRPNLVGTPSADCGGGRLSGCIRAAAFETPSQYTYGTAGRNLFHGPRLFDTDLSIAKNFGSPNGSTPCAEALISEFAHQQSECSLRNGNLWEHHVHFDRQPRSNLGAGLAGEHDLCTTHEHESDITE
jgi:hypothetical protein